MDFQNITEEGHFNPLGTGCSGSLNPSISHTYTKKNYICVHRIVTLTSDIRSCSALSNCALVKQVIALPGYGGSEGVSISPFNFWPCFGAGDECQ
jgi:hypothetical protein